MQTAGGMETNASLSSSQNIDQGANQSFAWNDQNYFVMNNQTATMTADQRTALMARTEDFIAAYPANRMFIMPLNDLNAFDTSGRGDVVVLNAGFGPVPLSFRSLPVLNIPLNQLTARMGEMPTGSTIAVISDSDMASATAATLLRMQGYNAWAVNTGAC
jgi:rhodanese-related sulfurtransferase